MTATDSRSRPRGQADAQLEGRYWPAAIDPPRLADGTVYIRALLRIYDEQANAGLTTQETR